jgi:hypothetical protein
VGREKLALGFRLLLLLLTGLTVAWAWHEGWQPNPAPARRGLVLLLWLLAAFELMLLPVYHGTFFADTIVRRLEGAPDGVGGSAGDICSARRPRLITVDAMALNGLPLVGVAHVSKLLEMQGCPEP